MKTLVMAFLCASLLAPLAMASKHNSAMTAGNLQQICTSSDPYDKAACRFYILGISQGISVGMGIADGTTKGKRPCIPDNTPGAMLELAVKMKLGQDLMVFPSDKKLDASGMIGGLLISTFPCRTGH